MKENEYHADFPPVFVGLAAFWTYQAASPA